MECSDLGVYKGHGAPGHQETRGPQEEGVRESPSRRDTIAQKKAQVSKAPKSGAGGGVTIDGGPSLHGIQNIGEAPEKAQILSPLCSSGSFPQKFSFWRWCSGVVISIRRTRSPFAAFLLSTLHLPRSSSLTSTSPLFPVPLPEPGIFDRMPAHASLSQRRRLHLKRVLHVLIMALNYWRGGLGVFPNKALLQRCPSKVHRTIYHKVMSIVVADGPESASFKVLKSGRRFPQLGARLGELSDCLSKRGPAGPYSFMFKGHEVPLDNDRLPELADLGYAITRPGHAFHFHQAIGAAARSGVTGVHQWSTSARVAQEVYEPLIGIQYPMLCGPKNGQWHIGTVSIREKGAMATGLRFVNWEHHDHRDEARAEPPPEATVAAYRCIERWLPDTV